MKRISVRELHLDTGKIVRRAKTTAYLVTDRGQPVAVLQPYVEKDFGVGLSEREHWIARQPRLNVDSTDVVSDDRNR